MSSLGKTRLYYAACICLLIMAAVLRFNDLTGHSLHGDEAVAALNSRGGFTEVVERTRSDNSSPIIYPYILYSEWPPSVIQPIRREGEHP